MEKGTIHPQSLHPGGMTPHSRPRPAFEWRSWLSESWAKHVGSMQERVGSHLGLNSPPGLVLQVMRVALGGLQGGVALRGVGVACWWVWIEGGVGAVWGRGDEVKER